MTFRPDQAGNMAANVAATAAIKVAGVTDWTNQMVTVRGEPGEWLVVKAERHHAYGNIATVRQGDRVVRVSAERLQGVKA